MTTKHPISFKTIPTLSLLKSAYPELKALFFDMDGTLFNTEPHHQKAFMQIGNEHQIRPPYSKETVHELLVGKADHLAFEVIKEWEGFPKHWSARDFVKEKNERILKLIQESPPASFFPDGLKDLLEQAQAAGFFLALVTSSEKVVTQKLIETAGLTGFFDLELTRDDCPSHKPDPWPYNEARRISGLGKSEILIFEDSSVGLMAAMESGAHVVKVEWY